jgi:hypothetical protein
VLLLLAGLVQVVMLLLVIRHQLHLLCRLLLLLSAGWLLLH